MIKKRIKEAGAVLVALALTLSALTLPGAHAANAVDTGKSCSVEFSIGGDYKEDLEKVNVPINLYKVASIDASGSYTAEQGFDSVDFGAIENGEGTAEAWLERADMSAKLTEGVSPTASTETVAGKAALSNMEVGLYLVMAEDTDSEYYNYSFKPYLISLPNNYYYTSGDDTWVYDLTGTNAIGLKPEQKERYGTLVINKELVDQNITFGGKATFVFQIDITPIKGEASSQQVALTFDQYGSKEAVVEKLPAGASVKVTEIYSGAGYELTADSSVEQSITIVADESVSVGFKNQHDGKLSGGYGVVNNFKLNDDGQYDWNQLEDNANKAEYEVRSHEKKV